VSFPDGWGLVRASNTQPVLVLRFEGRTPEALRRIAGEFRRALAAHPEASWPAGLGETD
jgi:phosphomannomutase/phosphoglucomutase